MSQPNFYQTNSFVICLVLLAIFASFGYIVGKDNKNTHLHKQQSQQLHQKQPDTENKKS